MNEQRFGGQQLRASERTARFEEQMLESTFAFARIALTNSVLLNGAGATAILAFMSNSPSMVPQPFRDAVLWFGAGACCGGWASVLAYLGQRIDWDNRLTGKGWRAFGSTSISAAVLTCLLAYALFTWGAWVASTALR